MLSKSLWESKSLDNSYQRVQMIDILLKYMLWYEFVNDLDAQSDFEKKNCHKKAGQVEQFLSKVCSKSNSNSMKCLAVHDDLY